MKLLSHIKNSINRFNEWFDSQNSILQLIMLISFAFCVRTFIFGLYIVPTGSMEPTMLVGEVFYSDKLTVMFRKINHGDIISINDPTFNYSKNFFMRLFQNYVWGPDNWTKRVIGVPGDHIQGKIIDGKTVIIRNGKVIDEPYVNPYPLVKVMEKAHQLRLKAPFMIEEQNIRLRTFVPQYPIDDFEHQPFYHIAVDSLLPNACNPMIYYPHVASLGEDSVTNVFDIVLKEDEYWLMGDNRRGSFDSRGFGKVNRNLIHGRIIFRLFSFDTTNSLLYELVINPIYFIRHKLRPWKRWFSFFNNNRGQDGRELFPVTQ